MLSKQGIRSVYGKTVCTTAAVIVSLRGGSGPSPSTSSKEQNWSKRYRQM